VTAIALQLENRRLKKQLAERDAIIADQAALTLKLQRDIEQLQKIVKQLLATRGGGHHIPEGQGLLFSDLAIAPEGIEAPSDESDSGDDGDGDSEADCKRPQRGKGSKRTPRKVDTTGLPVEHRVHDIPESQRIDPATGKPLIVVGEKTFDEIDYIRAQLIVVRHKQLIYGLPPEEAEHRKVAPVVADLPPRPLENCAASARLLAWLVVQKWANHLPLYRQEQIFGRDGKHIPRQTLCDWALNAAELLAPIAACQMALSRAGPVMQLDDTPVQCQGGRGESNFQAYLWSFVNPEVNGVAYRFTPGRSKELIAAELGDFTGNLVGDGYSGNRAAAKIVSESTGKPIHMGGCWSHVIRKFRDARKEAPSMAELFCVDIGKLFDIEREADDAELSPAERVACRQQKSKPILMDIYSRARTCLGSYSDSGSLIKAIGYIRGQYRPLRRFLEDGLVPIHNNACERAIRPIAVGRRSWLFAGSVRGGHAAAVIYTLIECCRLADVNMLSYLEDVLVRVATHPAKLVHQLLPANWVKRFAPAAPELALA
jgi:transposase